MSKEHGNTGKYSTEDLRYLSKEYNGGGAKWGIHLVDNDHLPALPPLTREFNVAQVERERDLLSRTRSNGSTYPFYFEDIEVEVSTTNGDVALIGAIAEDRYHLDPESLLPISEGHHATDIPDVRSMSVAELALLQDLTGDKIENVAHYLLGEERKTVQWAPRTAYRKSLPTGETSQPPREDADTPTYDELSPEEKRNHLIDVMGAVTSIAVDEDTPGTSNQEITEVLSLLVGNLDTEIEAIDAERLSAGADRATEVAWTYAEAAIQEAKETSDFTSSSTLWEAQGITLPKRPNLDIAESLIPNAKKIFLEKRARHMDANDRTKLRLT